MRRCYWLCASALALETSISTGLAQSEQPSIPESGTRIEDFLPDGYQIFERAEADFNGDRRTDVVLLLSSADETTGPRPLIILFNQASGGYRLSARSDKFAPEPFELGVKNPKAAGVLEVKEDLLMVNRSGGMGSSGFSNAFGFKFKGDDWFLVGEWESEYGFDLDCLGLSPPKQTAESCRWHGTHVDFESNRKTEGWLIYDARTGKEKKRERTIAMPREDLRRLVEVEP